MNSNTIYHNFKNIDEITQYFDNLIASLKSDISNLEPGDRVGYSRLSKEISRALEQKQSEINGLLKQNRKDKIKAQKAEMAEVMLGINPSNFQEYVHAFVKKYNIEIRLDNSLHGSTYEGSAKIENTKTLRDVLYELKGVSYLALNDLGNDEEFNTSFNLYLANNTQQRKAALVEKCSFNNIKNDPELLKATEESLREIVETVFEYDGQTEQSFELVLAAFKKSLWQIKRKMVGLSVSYPIMPILFGEDEGTGKSTFVKMVLEPIAENIISSVSYDDLTDKSNIGLWGSWCAIIEELAGFGKSEQAKLNDIITRESHPVRILYSHHGVQVKNSLSLWGTTNFPIKEIIKSAGYMRRFFQFHWKPRLGSGSKSDVYKLRETFQKISAVDWLSVFRSIDENAVDPLIGYEHELRSAQLQLRHKSPIEEWIEAIYENPDELEYGDDDIWNVPRGGQSLFRMYKKWAAECGTTWAKQYTLKKFGQELKLLKCVRYNTSDRRYSLMNHTKGCRG